MKSSIIIPSFNGGQRILKLLACLQPQAKEEFEVVLVLDGSTDNSLEIVRKGDLKPVHLQIVEQKNKGRAGARNSGARVASGDLLLFFDDDMELDEKVLEKHVMHHTTVSSSILVGNLLEDGRQTLNDVQAYKVHLSKKWMGELGDKKKVLDVFFLSAANMSVPKKLFQSLGGFDERLRDCEDYELAVRAAKSAISIYYDPTIVAYHVDRITAHSYANRLKEYKKERTKVLDIHPELKANEPRTKHFRNLIYFFFSFRFWLAMIDKNQLMWLPLRFRYRFYDVVFHSQTIFD